MNQFEKEAKLKEYNATQKGRTHIENALNSFEYCSMLGGTKKKLENLLLVVDNRLEDIRDEIEKDSVIRP